MNCFGLNDANKMAKMVILKWDDEYFTLGRGQCVFRATFTVQYSEGRK